MKSNYKYIRTGTKVYYVTNNMKHKGKRFNTSISKYIQVEMNRDILLNFGIFLMTSLIIILMSLFVTKVIGVDAANLSNVEFVNSEMDTALHFNDIVDTNLQNKMINNNSYKEFDSTINDTNITESSSLVECALPSDYYNNINFSWFQPFMAYQKITDKTSPSYEICYSENAYTDENGFRRYKTNEHQFTVDGNDDYVVALGTYYKEKGTVGSRFLIETTTGSYTVITGGEKADEDTDELNMFSTHCDGDYAGMIEWIVDENTLHSDIKYAGTVTYGPVESMHGDIIAIYRIDE